MKKWSVVQGFDVAIEIHTLQGFIRAATTLWVSCQPRHNAEGAVYRRTCTRLVKPREALRSSICDTTILCKEMEVSGEQEQGSGEGGEEKRGG